MWFFNSVFIWVRVYFRQKFVIWELSKTLTIFSFIPETYCPLGGKWGVCGNIGCMHVGILAKRHSILGSWVVARCIIHCFRSTLFLLLHVRDEYQIPKHFKVNTDYNCHFILQNHSFLFQNNKIIYFDLFTFNNLQPKSIFKVWYSLRAIWEMCFEWKSGPLTEKHKQETFSKPLSFKLCAP